MELIKVLMGSSYFMSWEVVIKMSGAFKYLWSEQDGNAPFLHKILQVFF